MNAEQLASFAKRATDDVSQSEVATAFDDLVNQLSSLAANPGDVATQEAVAAARNKLFGSLSDLHAKPWPPGMRQVLSDVGAEILVSRDLKREVEIIVQQEAVTPATAQKKIDRLRAEFNGVISKLVNLDSALTALGIQEVPLKPGEVEIGILFPRDSKEIDNKIDKLASEVLCVDKIFKLFSVVAIGTREEFEIRYISSSDPKIFLKVNPKTAALISAAVMFIIEALNGVADLALKAEQLREGGLSEKYISEIKQGIEEKLEEELEGIGEQLHKDYGRKGKTAEKNEDRSRLGKAVDQLAPRLERGYSVEVRVEPLPEPDAPAEEGSDESEALKTYRTLIETAANLKRLSPPAGGPLLELPDNRPDTSGENGEV